MNRVAVIGGGAFGTALANAAAEAGREVTLCVRDPAVAASLAASRTNPRLPGIALHRDLRPSADLDAVKQAEIALLVVPAQQVRVAVERLLPVLRLSCPLVVCAKGIERGSGAFMSEICEDLSPDLLMAILSGPSFAADLGRGLPTAVTLACHDPVTAMRLAGALSGPAFRIYHSGDVRGVEIGGAAKNVLAIAAGIVVGRDLGESARAALVARGFAELRRFALACGARAETLMGLSGLGDVVMSCASAKSRNFAFGERIGGGMSPGDAGEGTLAEGAFTAEALLERARAQGVDMPVAEAVADIVAGRLSVDEAMAGLLARPLRPEHD